MLTQKDKTGKLKAHVIDTPLGRLMAVADEEALYQLEFWEEKEMIQGKTAPLMMIEKELKLYFSGKLRQFQTPMKMVGSPFQQAVWTALCAIPYGETCSYAHIAQHIQNPRAVRAVGTANGVNRMAIVIPCHRVINANGNLGGYGGGLDKKKWLLAHEQKYLHLRESHA